MSSAEAAMEAARITDPVEHGLGMLGLLAGLLLGVLVGVALVAATVATGGAALVVALAVVGAVGLAAGGGLAGQQLAHGLSTLTNFGGITTGSINPPGSPNVVIGTLPAARAVLDTANCDGLFFTYHFYLPGTPIAEGSQSVLINGMPAARKGDHCVCAADIQSGDPTVLFGGPTAQMLAISDREAQAAHLLGIIGLGALFAGAALLLGGYLLGAICGTVLLEALGTGLLFFGGNELLGLLGDALGPGWRDTLQGAFGLAGVLAAGWQGLRSFQAGRPFFGEPVDGVTGEVCHQKTDFSLLGALELALTRTYISGASQRGCFGPKWRSTWGQYIEVDGAAAIYHTDDGRSIGFDVSPTDGQRRVGSWIQNRFVRRIKLRLGASWIEVVDEARRLLRFECQIENRWLLTSIQDQNLNTIRLEHDETGALRRVNHSGGYELAVEGTATEIRRIALLEPHGVISELTRYEYDEKGRLAGVIDGSGYPLRYTYDEADRLVKWVDRRGSWYQYTYDVEGRCVEATGPEGIFHYRFAYDPERRLNTITDSMGNATTLEYDHRLLEVVRRDPRGGVTRTVWDDRLNKIETIDASGGSTQYTYDDDGALLSQQDPVGRVSRFGYNADGQLAALVDPTGRVWSRSYDERGNLIELASDDGLRWKYQRDPSGNLVQITNPAGKTCECGYDRVGLPLWATDWERHKTSVKRDARGRPVETTDPLGGKTTYEYNTQGKIRRISYPSGVQVRLEYDVEGNLIRRLDADACTFVYRYGWFDQLEELQRPTGGCIRLRYDTEGRLAEVINERGERHLSTYNEVGQIEREIDFTGQTVLFEHDLAGRCVAQIDGAGQKTLFQRDAAGRLVGQIMPDGAETRFEYDPMDRLVSAIRDQAEVRFERDAYGRVLRETQNGRTIESAFDARGNRVRRRTSSGHESTWHFDANGRHTALTLPGNEVLAFERDALGREVRRYSGKGLSVRSVFDACNHLTEQAALSEKLGTPDSGQTAPPGPSRRYRYDVLGNVREVDDNRWGKSLFGCDLDGRLTRVEHEGGPTELFHYDEGDNIVQSSVRSASTSLHSQQNALPAATAGAREYEQGGRLRRAGATRYEYDADGRMVARVERSGSSEERRWRYDWTSDGRLRRVTAPDGRRWSYRYDAFGRRVSKEGPEGLTEYIWDGTVVAEVLKQGSEPVVLLHEPGTFRPLAKQEGEQAYVCVTDPVGTPRELLTLTGKVAWAGRLSAWGELEQVLERETDWPVRFQGQWSDDETGLVFNWHRYYDPQIGRYLSPDPIGLEGGLNAYNYVKNPMNWVDPRGLEGCTPGGAQAPREIHITGDVTDSVIIIGDGNVVIRGGSGPNAITPGSQIIPGVDNMAIPGLVTIEGSVTNTVIIIGNNNVVYLP